MEVITAKNAGFCFGVKKAVDMVESQAKDNTGKNIYTYGPIIHNEEVVKSLEEKGVHAVRSKEELDKIACDTNNVMIIRSHGISKAEQDDLVKKGFEIIDATCPFVKRIHNTVREESEKGKHIIIIGNKNHPEVEGIMGWSTTPPTVIESLEEVDDISFEKDTSYCVVAQTTFNHNKFKEIVEKIQTLGYDVNVVTTICNATYERQSESRKIAAKVDTMIVIGDTHSSNSKKLYEICKEECEDTHFIQTLDDLNLDLTKSVRLVGITAGASTPDYIIEEVQNYVRVDF
ncbi:MAG: 4-hydroxy-3-methylbut-2-enyl diphosphate reductase [Lachnospiraceae bacterium]|nr:4-hydroxy-3-methylbut-2-enyl diphosphate reductase [Lachnospiraceae bacterium]MBP5414272.1 4-hydroxy-3-methylbut-2-enyl diphosphate reductase [Lachnospiraceae bacterium]